MAPATTDIAQVAPDPLAQNAANNSPASVNLNVAAASGAAVAAAGSSTAAAIIDVHAGKTQSSDSGASDSAQAAAVPPVDPSANQAGPLTPQPVAVVVSAPVIPAAPATIGSGGTTGTGSDTARIAALRGSAAGGPGGTADRATDGAKIGAPAAGSAAAGAPQTDGSDPTAGSKAAEAARSTPLPTPPLPQKEPPGGTGQPNAADAAQARNADAVPTKAAAAADQARRRATTGQPADGTVRSQGNPNGNPNGNSNVDANVDPKQDPAAVTAAQIEELARQALDKTARQAQAPPSESAGGSLHPDTAPAANAPPSPDGSSNLIAPASLTTATAAAPAATETPTAVPIAGLAVEIAAHAHAGKNRFEIRLDPPELGRINVRLDVDHDGKVTSRLVVDRQETLDLLRRDAPALEHALQQAGLKTADDALQFSLRDQGGFGGQNRFGQNPNPNPDYGSPADAARVIIPDRGLPPVEATTAAHGRLTSTSMGIDIRV